MRTTTVIAAVLFATTAACAGQLKAGPGVIGTRSEVPSCDVFTKRLKEAGRVLTYPLPVVKIERNPNVDQEDAFWVSYEFSAGPDKRWWDGTFEGALTCKDGKFVDFGINYPFTDKAMGAGDVIDAGQRRAQIAGAAVYAFTGKTPREVIKIVNGGMAKLPGSVMEKGPAVPLTTGVDINFDFSSLMIDAGE